MTRRAAFLVAGVTGFLGIALGAFGAHALKGVLASHQTLAIWNTAVLYHLIHAPVLLWLAGRERIIITPILLFSLGVILFSGSLYALALTDIRWIGAITPFGGLLLMAGWLWIAIMAWHEKATSGRE
jgi:uncharacterized membrane protein YgdD (TMEM256/DUF423 family)